MIIWRRYRQANEATLFTDQGRAGLQVEILILALTSPATNGGNDENAETEDLTEVAVKVQPIPHTGLGTQRFNPRALPAQLTL